MRSVAAAGASSAGDDDRGRSAVLLLAPTGVLAAVAAITNFLALGLSSQATSLPRAELDLLGGLAAIAARCDGSRRGRVYGRSLGRICGRGRSGKDARRAIGRRGSLVGGEGEACERNH